MLHKNFLFYVPLLLFAGCKQQVVGANGLYEGNQTVIIKENYKNP